MEVNSYIPPALLFNRHFETIYPSLFRKVDVPYQRERITTVDDDFLDLDWLRGGSDKLVIISHGLEGNSTRPYVTGMARLLFRNDYDVLAWNYRGCSEEMNRQLRFYHSGATDDLDTVLSHALTMGYKEINLIGFSLGGNLTLKYLGEKADTATSLIQKAVVFSVPMDLHSSCIEISRPHNLVYATRFLRSLKKKVADKARIEPGLDTKHFKYIKTLMDFDDQYTAPIHGFKNAIDYYTRSSSLHFVSHIKIPTLIVNAANDPFLTRECYPEQLLKKHSHVMLEIPTRGGHCGFSLFNQKGVYWSELKALAFIQAL